MAELTVERTYATALFEVAEEANKTEAILQDIKDLAGLFATEENFGRFVGAPTVSAEEKKQVLASVLKGHVEPETLNFLYVLMSKGRAGRFAGIAASFERLVDEAKGLTPGKVISARPLSEAQLLKLQEKMSGLIGKNVKLTSEEDPSLIAGVVVQVDGKIFDASYKKRIKDLTNAMNREDIV